MRPCFGSTARTRFVAALRFYHSRICHMLPAPLGIIPERASIGSVAAVRPLLSVSREALLKIRRYDGL